MLVVTEETLLLKTTSPDWRVILPLPPVEVETAIGPPLKVYVPAVCMNSMELGETPLAATVTLGTLMPLSSKTTLLPLANATAPLENQLVGPPTCQVELPAPVQVRVGLPGLTVSTRLLPEGATE